jgi:hypothetical protein
VTTGQVVVCACDKCSAAERHTVWMRLVEGEGKAQLRKKPQKE